MAVRAAGAVPVLRTARLTLRAHRCEDFPAYAEVACGPHGSGVGGPMSRADAWLDFVQGASGWMLHGHGGWTICETGGEAALGFVMIGLEPGDQEPELGWLVTAAAEGRGIAFEAATAARAHALGPLALPSLVSYIAGDNHRSIRLAERLGAHRDRAAEAALDDPDMLVYRHAPKGPLQ
jgi:RimJ/RimL family protein N-acetyltransferase